MCYLLPKSFCLYKSRHYKSYIKFECHYFCNTCCRLNVIMKKHIDTFFLSKCLFAESTQQHHLLSNVHTVVKGGPNLICSVTLSLITCIRFWSLSYAVLYLIHTFLEFYRSAGVALLTISFIF